MLRGELGDTGRARQLSTTAFKLGTEWRPEGGKR